MTNTLIEALIENTGLPRNLVQKELHEILRLYHSNEENISLDDLREVMADYLQDTFLELKAKS